MDVVGRTYWTWCALDAIEILAAIGRDGTVSTSELETGSPMVIAFDGLPTASSAALLLPAMSSGSSANVINDWCSGVPEAADQPQLASWRPSTGASPTTPSAGSLTTCCEPTSSSLTRLC